MIHGFKEQESRIFENLAGLGLKHTSWYEDFRCSNCKSFFNIEG